MVQNLLGVAIKTHGTSRFREMLCWTHYRSGKAKNSMQSGTMARGTKRALGRHLRATLWGGP